jgi:hypothetical protein
MSAIFYRDIIFDMLGGSWIAGVCRVGQAVNAEGARVFTRGLSRASVCLSIFLVN